MNQNAMYKIGYGLYVLTGRTDFDNGCIINTAMQVTTTPNRISVTVNKNNKTHDMILESGKFNVSVISEKADFELFQHFGFQSGKEVNKFEVIYRGGLLEETKPLQSFILASISVSTTNPLPQTV